MLVDDITGECDGMGGGAWCCPATNGAEVISECHLEAIGKPCPSDKPQELTSIMPLEGAGESSAKKYCCPRDPVGNQQEAMGRKTDDAYLGIQKLCMAWQGRHM
jgi:hypothetical protein